jgi:hypothetical protein
MPSPRRAVVIGIDEYQGPWAPLRACVNDAMSTAESLYSNADEEKRRNFSVCRRTSDRGLAPTTAQLRADLKWLFEGPAEVTVLYFAGHGAIAADGRCYLVTADAGRPDDGISLEEIVDQANEAGGRIGSTVIILDACYAGSAGNVAAPRMEGRALIGEGVTIMTAAGRSQTADELGDHGLVTGLLLQGLQGGAADICGRITPASLYSYVDQTLGDHRQRPLYKSNVDRFVVLRQVTPRVALQTLQSLPIWFKTHDARFQLDPSCEPDRGQETERLQHVPVDPERERIYRQLQACNRQGLVSPHPPEKYERHMWHAAVYEGTCQLTDVGQHYRRLARLGLLGGGIPDADVEDILLEGDSHLLREPQSGNRT